MSRNRPSARNNNAAVISESSDLPDTELSSSISHTDSLTYVPPSENEIVADEASDSLLRRAVRIAHLLGYDKSKIRRVAWS
jgi:hypothetical protein